MSLTQPLPFVEPEEVEAFEVGAKYATGDLNVNLAAFFHRLRERPVLAHPADSGAALLHQHADQCGGIGRLWRRARAAVAARRPNSRSTPRWPTCTPEFTNFFSKDPLDPALFGPGGASVPDQDLSGNATRMSPEWSVNLYPDLRHRPGQWRHDHAGLELRLSQQAVPHRVQRRTAVAGRLHHARREHPLSGARTATSASTCGRRTSPTSWSMRGASRSRRAARSAAR